MVRVLATDLDVDGRAQRFRERAEEVGHELGRQLADLVATERPFEHEVRTARQIDGDTRERLVHRQHESVPVDAVLVAKSRLQRLSQRERAVLDRVVLVDVQVASTRELQ